ncbi:carotenoid oxygenase [Phascolomyces articulosus]|uniref:Carotenoid oxygenase n=1 Tax=Phascolomyces articulosus TaxID=60185 RepID=A0AAD5PIZ7_9FUNG|nr:carotenoid oxygenase [Phascolomyces articulosus]
MGFFEYINLNNRIRSFQSLNKFRNTPQVADPIWCPIEGSIPPWVNGILYRTGPGKYNLGDDEKQYVIQHAFDGLPFVHRFELSAEKQAVRYNNRMIAEDVESNLVKNPNSNQIFFGHVPTWSNWRGFINMLARLGSIAVAPSKNERGRSNEMVGVTVTPNFPLPSKFSLAPNDDHVLVTKTDANILQHVHSTTLEPERLFDYSDYDENFAGVLSAAHHQRDPNTNETFNFSINFGRETSMTVFSIDAKGNNKVLAKITQRLLPNGKQSSILPAYIHSFWLTENYVIIPESPLHYANNGLDVLVHGVISTAMAWKEDSPTYLHVISRDPSVGHVVSLPVDNPFFTFHTGNAWDYVDKDGNPVLELECCAVDSGDILYQVARYGGMERYEGENKQKHLTPMNQGKQRGMTIPPSPTTEFGDFHRYRATWNKKAKTGQVSYNVIAKNVEFPRFAPQLACQKTRYVWGCQHESATANNSERFSLIKLDTETGKITKIDQGCTMFSEPVFVPNPDSKTGDEDDGALLSFANFIDPRGSHHDRCILSVVDAKTMKEMGRCDIGQFVATTFHGSFVDVDFVSVSIS